MGKTNYQTGLSGSERNSIPAHSSPTQYIQTSKYPSLFKDNLNFDEIHNEKHCELIQYIINYNFKTNKQPTIPDLYMYLFYIDFLAYRELGYSVSKDIYKRSMDYPIPTKGKIIIEELIQSSIHTAKIGLLKSIFNVITFKSEPEIIETSFLANFSTQERKIINHVLSYYQGNSETMKEELSHFIGWNVVQEGEVIPYGCVVMDYHDMENTAEFPPAYIDQAYDKMEQILTSEHQKEK